MEVEHTISEVTCVAAVKFIERKLVMSAVESFTTTQVVKHVAIKLVGILCLQRLESCALHDRQRPSEHIMSNDCEASIFEVI